MFLASFSFFFPFLRREGLEEIFNLIRSSEEFHFVLKALTAMGESSTDSRVGCLAFLQCWALPGLQTEHWEAPFCAAQCLKDGSC